LSPPQLLDLWSEAGAALPSNPPCLLLSWYGHSQMGRNATFQLTPIGILNWPSGIPPRSWHLRLQPNRWPALMVYPTP